MRARIINTTHARNAYVIGEIITIEEEYSGMYRFKEDLGTGNQRILARNIKILPDKNIIGGKLL